jgi:hypothetical protein
VSYQSLLDRAVALVQAERGFIVLYDPTTRAFGEYVAAHNFDPLPYPYPEDPAPETIFYEANAVWEYMIEAIQHGRPLATVNESMSTFDSYAPRRRLRFDPPARTLRCLMAVPLMRAGVIYALLWCDQRLKMALWKELELAQVVDLVQQFLEL